jgi:predicted transporter
MNRVGFLLKIGLGLGFAKIGLACEEIGLASAWLFLAYFSTFSKNSSADI